MADDQQPISGRRVLVTGAYGLLGSAVVKLALGSGAAVSTVSRERHPESALVKNGLANECTRYEADVSDKDAVDRVFGSALPDVVIHLAGVSVVGEAQLLPREAVESSVVGTLNVLEAAKATDTQAVAVASSDKAYGASEQLPYTEDVPLQPKFPYEAAKAAADVIARSYWFSYGLPTSVIRSANLYGGGDWNLTRLVPQTIGCILGGRAPTLRSDGRTERDYLYVEDAAAAYMEVVSLLLGGDGAGEPFNVGSGVARPTIEVVEEILRVAGSDLEPEIQGTGVPQGEIERQVIDSSKLEAATGWKATTPLEDGLARTLAWYREYPQALRI